MRYNTRKEDDLLEKERANFKVKCKHCGHVVVMVTVNRLICNHCGHYIYRNDAEEFKFNLMNKLGKKYHGEA